MRMILIGLSMVLVSGIAHAEDSKPQIFDCINSSSFEVNSECMSNTISVNNMFPQAQQKIVFEAAYNSNTLFKLWFIGMLLLRCDQAEQAKPR